MRYKILCLAFLWSHFAKASEQVPVVEAITHQHLAAALAIAMAASSSGAASAAAGNAGNLTWLSGIAVPVAPIAVPAAASVPVLTIADFDAQLALLVSSEIPEGADPTSDPAVGNFIRYLHSVFIGQNQLTRDQLALLLQHCAVRSGLLRILLDRHLISIGVLHEAGFGAEPIRNAGATLGELYAYFTAWVKREAKRKKLTLKVLRNEGLSIRIILEIKKRRPTWQAFADAGFPLHEFVEAKATLEEIVALTAGDKGKKKKFTLCMLLTSGFFEPRDLEGHFSFDQLVAACRASNRLCLAEIIAEGWAAGNLESMGYTPDQSDAANAYKVQGSASAAAGPVVEESETESELDGYEYDVDEHDEHSSPSTAAAAAAAAAAAGAAAAEPPPGAIVRRRGDGLVQRVVSRVFRRSSDRAGSATHQ